MNRDEPAILIFKIYLEKITHYMVSVKRIAVVALNMQASEKRAILTPKLVVNTAHVCNKIPLSNKIKSHGKRCTTESSSNIRCLLFISTTSRPKFVQVCLKSDGFRREITIGNKVVSCQSPILVLPDAQDTHQHVYK